MPDFIMMVGLPYSGKSYYTESMNLKEGKVIVSLDNEVHELARAIGKTYNEVFNDVVSSAQENATNTFISALNRSESILLDQTNLTRASRARKLSLVPSSYRKICIVVPQPTDYEIELRKQARKSHSVPDSVVSYMKEVYQSPSLDEGFDVVYVAGFDDIVLCR